MDKLASATTQRMESIEERMDQFTSMYKNVEVQIGQIANAINNRGQGELPSKTEANPWEHVKAITLHSGKQLSESRVVREEK